MLSLVLLSKNLIDRFAFLESPDVKSSGDRIVVRATCNPSKSIGGARDPEWCWAYAGATEIVTNPTSSNKINFGIIILDILKILKCDIKSLRH